MPIKIYWQLSIYRAYSEKKFHNLQTWQDSKTDLKSEKNLKKKKK